ncbi:2-iminobutanoate/2-iminopropanoate deaminase isoform 2-T2 [Spinachia spinachia]
MASIRRQIPYTPKAPVRQGVYSQSVVVDRTMYISGQLGMDVASGQLVDGGVKAQAKQALINMGEILKAADCDYTNVVKTTVLLADINDFNGVNEVYKTWWAGGNRGGRCPRSSLRLLTRRPHHKQVVVQPSRDQWKPSCISR